jgi:peroxiredoxin Q/BCP
MNKFHVLLGICAALALTSIVCPAAPADSKLKAGDTAPSFEGQDQDGKTWRLSDLTGKQQAVLLYFYPKDDTPGCTKQACGLRDQMTDLKAQGIQVIGVSFDNAASHKKFQEKHQLNFPLLADVDGKIADTYGVRRDPGKRMARRVSFLIGPDAKIVHITDNSAADVHLSEMKSAVSQLKKG